MSKLLIALTLLVLSTPACSTEKPDNRTSVKSAPVEKEAVTVNPAENIMAAEDTSMTGEALFLQHCVRCHKEGGNILNKSKPIDKTSLMKNNIATPEDIVKIMRNPGPKMKKYSEEMIPDSEAMKIGTYIRETFE